MAFKSILFPPSIRNPELPDSSPEYFSDLNLDQVVDSITSLAPVYDIKPLFHAPLDAIDSITYRHDVFSDLKNPNLCEAVEEFAKMMREMEERIEQAEKSHHQLVEARWFLDAVLIYCSAINKLNADLGDIKKKSSGFTELCKYLKNYVDSEQFSSLSEHAEKCKSDLVEITYCVLIDGSSVTITRYQEETDYGLEILKAFERFKQKDAQNYRQDFSDWERLNQVEIRILEKVSKLYPEEFDGLLSFHSSNEGYLDETINRFDREVQFYMAYQKYMHKMEMVELDFCFPEIATDNKNIYANATFDIALAHKLVADDIAAVKNDFYIEDPERIIVISGPNQGGKTTFARMFGQLHYIARLGCPVPGTKARLFLYDYLFTHFERAEEIQNLRGKLEDDLVRIHAILEQATANSIVIMNEIFSSTTTLDARFLGEQVLLKLIDLDALCLCVTFIDELSRLSENTISMVSTVEPDNPALRTFKIIRQSADGLAYAKSLAKKHRLTREALRMRL